MAKFERAVNLTELRSEMVENEMILEGYAAVFNQPTVLFTDSRGKEFKEVIDRHAFDECDFSKCCLKYNHESSIPVLARVRGGSLELGVDDYGLHFRGKLFNTTTSRDMYELVKAGGIDECSFAFTIDGIDGDSYDSKTRTRTLKRISNLFDVAIVDNPAYGGTSVAARSFLEAEAEKEKLENEERENKRKKKILELTIGGF